MEPKNDYNLNLTELSQTELVDNSGGVALGLVGMAAAMTAGAIFLAPLAAAAYMGWNAY